MSEVNVISFADALNKANELGKRKHLLLGNGFSIDCDKRFSYPNLFKFACENGLSLRAQEVFNYLGTNNFEGVLRLIEDSLRIAQIYEVADASAVENLQVDLELIKKSLVAAIAETHLEKTNDVSEEKKQSCVEFLTSFHNVFTTNYDLLLYWVAMHGLSTLKEQDGFRAPAEDEDAVHLTFKERVGDERGIFFLHGALHLYVVKGEVRKHSWVRSHKCLTQLIQEGLAAGQYPLFVAEGIAERKREQIQRSGYLSYCLGKLERIENCLFIHGISLAENDQHIANTLADNFKLSHLYVGLFGDPDSSNNRSLQRSIDSIVERRNSRLHSSKKKAKPLTITFYKTETAHVWDGMR